MTQLENDIAIIAASGMFDAAYYGAQTSVYGTEAEMIAHYLSDGERRGFWPNRQFDPYLYLVINRDVAQACKSPFVHYILHGAVEGRAIDVAKSTVSNQNIMEMFAEISSRIGNLEAANSHNSSNVLQKRQHSVANASSAANQLLTIAKKFSNLGATDKYLRALYFEAEPTSYRAKLSKKGWKSILDRKILLKSMAKQMRRDLFKKQGVYEFHDKKKTVDLPPRVMHFIPNVFLGGSTQLVLDIFNALSHEYEMHVATSAFPKEGSHKGVVIHDLREPTSIDAVVNLLQLFRADLIHVHYWGDVDDPWYEKVFSAALQLKIPVIQNVNTPVQPYRSPAIAANVYVSEYVKREFRQPSDNTRSLVIYPGIDLTSFPFSEIRTEEVLNSIGMVYRLETDKLNMQTIELFIAIVKKRPRTRVFIIGGGSLHDPFLRMVCKSGLRENFVFTGYVDYDSLPGYYRQFSIFVVPVWKESFGQVAPFAMSAGRAIAGFDVGAISEIIGDASLLGEGVEDTSDIVVGLLDDKERMLKTGKLNSERARAMFDVKKMTDSYRKLYKEVVDQGRRVTLPTLEFGEKIEAIE